ncbi:ABC transporter permease [Bacillus sp. B15-48]|uniref:ABC transporter permease n=1 Tax=Bacillus sp. B15-48 TaxID=1548601 RepID=UPI00193FE5BF|nr:ABC transporter permease [Bacillus sp. B15-48]MBM4764172.1 ABC transporter permease [Bacillus sp. B15-48]
MFKAETLWKQRFGQFLKETSRYLRYIFNGHLVIVLLFLLGTAGFYYQEWIHTLDANFPAAAISAIILALALTYSPILTLLTEPDKMFMLPLESKLGDYFKRTGILSFFLQAYLLLILLAVVMPMYVKVTDGSFRSFFPFFLFLLGLKALNLFIRWKVQFYIEKNTHITDSLVRFSVNIVVLYLLFSGANPFIVLIPALLLVLLYVYYRGQTREKGLKWELLIELEEKRMGAFYRVANLFTDVPKLKDRVKRRKWLDFLAERIKYGQDNTFSHLFVRTFFRSGDYFGLFTRLTIIGAITIYFLTYGLGQVVLALLFLYLTGFQLLPLWNHHQHKLWVDLYPLQSATKEKAFTRLLSVVLAVQSLLFGLVISLKLEWGLAAVSVLLGLVFTVFFVYFYSKKRRQS